MYQEEYCSYSNPKTTKKDFKYDPVDEKKKENKCDNTVNISTSITINQSGDARGIGGNGSAGGSATGGSAATAVADSSSAASAIAANDNDVEPADDLEALEEDPAADEPEILKPGNDVVTSGGNATGGAGGSGGIGTGGTVTNTATVQIDTVVIISCDGNTSGANYKVGLKERNVDITMDEKGNTFVNGKKMHEEELANGTKVFIFKNTEEKQSEE